MTVKDKINIKKPLIKYNWRYLKIKTNHLINIGNKIQFFNNTNKTSIKIIKKT